MNPTTFDPGPLVDVKYEAEGERWTLVFAKTLPHPPDKVWAALTEPGQLGEWAPFTADRDLGAPGDATLTMIDRDASQDLPATVIRAQAPELLKYTWGDDRLRWDLAAVESGTRLTLRHTVAEKVWIPKAAAGWHLCLAVAERLLAGDPVGPIRGAAARDYGWEELNDAYADRLGIENTGWPADAL